MYLMAGWVMLCLFVVLTVLSNTSNPSIIKFQSSALLGLLWTVILTWLVMRLGLQVSSVKNFFKIVEKFLHVSVMKLNFAVWLEMLSHIFS